MLLKYLLNLQNELALFKGNNMKPYDFKRAYEIFISLCEEYGVQVKEGTGKIIKDGKPFDILSEIQK